MKCDGCEWKDAYKFEHEEHKKTLLMLEKTLEESNQIFVNTRDMIGFMEELRDSWSLNSRPTPAKVSYTPEYIGRRRDVNRRKD
jgi:hypothetical protein|tara:strand:- start:2105 stop:2356 length:252 start_codon:yes stop_codon:yes gene_type:complete